jgi:Polyketide cyclase / dehydrase and lipid transport
MTRRYAIASAELVASTPLKKTYDLVGSIDPTRFYGRYGPIPSVKLVVEEQGKWGAVGSSRRLILSDWGTVVEQVTDAKSPSFFAYDSRDFEKVFGRLIYGSRAEWSFAEVEGGTRIHWTYSFHPRPRQLPAVQLIVRSFWAPHMRRTLRKIVRALDAREAEQSVAA